MSNDPDAPQAEDCDDSDDSETEPAAKRSSPGSKRGGGRKKGKHTDGEVATSSAGGHANGGNASRDQPTRKHGLAWPNGDQDGASAWCGSNIGWSVVRVGLDSSRQTRPDRHFSDTPVQTP
jgi:hypothetical protein